jgi:hypothetical protein
MTIEDGAWKARAREAALATAGTGTPQLGIDFEILEGPSQGQHITAYLYFGEGSFDRTIESIRLCGWKGTNLADLTGITDNEVRIVVEQEEYNGKLYQKVKWINALGGVAVQNRMNAGEAADFAARMRGRIAAMAQGQRPTAPPSRAAQTTIPQSDDDIPF